MMETHTQPSLLTLGTAQLGVPYGIANTRGALSQSEAFSILDTAWNGGIRSFDTARVYGRSEERIGEWIGEWALSPYLITKIAKLSDNGLSAEQQVLHSFEQSMSSLRVEFVDALLMHHAPDLEAPGVQRLLESLVNEGRLGAYGVSVYDPEAIKRAYEDFGAVVSQAPMNLLDNRLVLSGALDKSVANGVKVFARSVFLQGLFFMNPEKLPNGFSDAVPLMRQLHKLAHEMETSLAALSLACSINTSGIYSTVIGGETPEQVQGFIAMSNANVLSDGDLEYAISESQMLMEKLMPVWLNNPSEWPRS